MTDEMVPLPHDCGLCMPGRCDRPDCPYTPGDDLDPGAAHEPQHAERALSLLMRALSAALLGWLCVAPAHAMTFDLRNGVLHAEGTIKAGDAESFAPLITKAALPPVIVITSLGGLIKDAVAMAELINEHAVPVVVSGQCSSACMLMFLASPRRAVVLGAKLGVHSASDADSKQESISSLAATLFMARYYDEMGAAPAIVVKMLVTPPEQMQWLSEADIAGLGARFIREAP